MDIAPQRKTISGLCRTRAQRGSSRTVRTTAQPTTAYIGDALESGVTSKMVGLQSRKNETRNMQRSTQLLTAANTRPYPPKTESPCAQLQRIHADLAVNRPPSHLLHRNGLTVVAGFSGQCLPRACRRPNFGRLRRDGQRWAGRWFGWGSRCSARPPRAAHNGNLQSRGLGQCESGANHRPLCARRGRAHPWGLCLCSRLLRPRPQTEAKEKVDISDVKEGQCYNSHCSYEGTHLVRSRPGDCRQDYYHDATLMAAVWTLKAGQIW